MTLRCAPPEFDSIEVLEHILDKGMMVDAWLRIGLVGLELARLKSRFVVAPERPDHGSTCRPCIRVRQSGGKNNLLHMCLGPTPPQKNTLDILDRVLDKGIVLEAWLRTEVAGVALSRPGERFVVSANGTRRNNASRRDQDNRLR